MRKHKHKMYGRLAKRIEVVKFIDAMDLAICEAFDRAYGTDFQVLINQCDSTASKELFDEVESLLKVVGNASN
jgi:hypothetical protein